MSARLLVVTGAAGTAVFVLCALSAVGGSQMKATGEVMAIDRCFEAALQKAVRLLRASELGAAYEDAWTEWADGEDSELWDTATADGVG